MITLFVAWRMTGWHMEPLLCGQYNGEMDVAIGGEHHLVILILH